MGIFDFLAEKAKEEQDGGAPSSILETERAKKKQENKIKETPKETPKEESPIEDMGQYKKAGAEAAQAANIEAALNPPSGDLAQESGRAAMLQAGVGPETPSPPPSGNLTQESDRAAMLKEQTAVPVPAPETAPPPASSTPPAAPIAPVTAVAGSPFVPVAPPASPAPPMTDVRSAQYAPNADAVQQALQDPDAVEKIAKIAKKRGRGILDALQAGLYGFAGIDKPTEYEKAQEAEQKAQEKEEDQAFAKIMAELDQKNAERRQEIEHQFQMGVAQARNQWDVNSAERAYQVTAEQSGLNRQSDLEIAKERWVQAAARTGKTPAEALKEFQEKLAETYGGKK